MHLTLDVDLFALDDDDRAFVLGLVDAVREYRDGGSSLAEEPETPA